MSLDAFNINPIIDNSRSLTDRLAILHQWILKTSPGIDRIAFALYEHETDLLKTFLNSTRFGKVIERYQCKLTESPSLSALAQSGGVRVIDGIQNTIKPNNLHSRWLLEQGYISSLTIPIFSSGHFFGFVFLDSTKPAFFTDTVQRDMMLYSHFFMMTVTSELTSIKAMTATARISKDFAQLRDFETGAHLERVALYSRLIAKEIAEQYQLNDEKIEYIYLFAPLHDIGKIGVPDSILLKPGALNNYERSIMQTHVVKGERIIRKILDDYDLNDLSDSSIMLNIVSFHHELLDGSGYPNQLTANEIPVEARIVTTADIFDALTNIRPYKAAWSYIHAMEELYKLVDKGKLDVACVDALANNESEVKKIMSVVKD